MKGRNSKLETCHQSWGFAEFRVLIFEFRYEAHDDT